MGNHEYCVDCGESDFHWGKPCNPEKVAARQAIERRDAERKKLGVGKMIDILDKLKVQYQVDENGHATFYWWDFK